MAKKSPRASRVARVTERYVEGVAVEHATLTDGSTAWNVVMERPGLRFACIGEPEARELAEQLRDVAWVESRS